MKEKSFWGKVWNVVWPLGIYMGVQIVVTIAGLLVSMIAVSLRYVDKEKMVNFRVLMEQSETLYYQWSMLFLLIAALICIPIYYRIYKKDCQKAGEVKRNIPIGNKDYLAIVVSGAALALGMNLLIDLTPLPEIFTGYEEVNEVMFGGSMILQVLAGGLFACIVEEFMMRGVTYLRMRRFWGKRKAIIFSALVFGIYHGYVVQGVYAFFLGLFFAWVYERYDNLWAPVLAHMSANLFIILLGENPVVLHALSSMVGYCLVTCISFIVFYYGWHWMKQTNPLVELEFVEKEPDTLKKLTEEYQEQEREEK